MTGREAVKTRIRVNEGRTVYICAELSYEKEKEPSGAFRPLMVKEQYQKTAIRDGDRQ